MEQIKKEPMDKTKLIELKEEEIVYLQQLLINQETTQLALKVRAGEHNLSLIDKFGVKD